MDFSPKLTAQTKQINRQRLVYEARVEREIEVNIEKYRARMDDLYTAATTVEKPRAILAEGDSWFRYMVGWRSSI